jgi:hypothetical protein
MVYVASDLPLPTSEWDERRPDFFVTDLPKPDAPVRRWFSKSLVYYVGSHEGCGCGFQVGQYGEDDPAGLEARDRSRRALAEFLTAALQTQGGLELYACWDGDQSIAPESRRRTCPADLLRDGVYFREKEMLEVTARS